MGYCPRCDMEFMEGIEVCSDCGGPLVDKAEYMKHKAEEDAKKQQDQAEALIKEQEGLKEFLDADESEREAAIAAIRESMMENPTYVKKSERYEDMRSSASAFLLVGVLLTAFAIVAWTGIVHLPFVGISGIIFKSTITILAIGCFIIMKKTNDDAAKIRKQVREEKKTSKQLMDWFRDNYTADSLDAMIVNEAEGQTFAPEEMDIKRMQYIQDIIVTTYDIADQAYADSLAEDIFEKMYL